MKKIILVAITIFAAQISAFAQNSDSFNLSGIIENIMNYQTKDEILMNTSKEAFISGTQNFHNGNIIVAYGEFTKTIEGLNENIPLLTLSKTLYEYGFFSLGDLALSKISGKNKPAHQIEILKNSYKPNYTLSKEEESYLAKAYASIYYNASPEEAAFNLIKKTQLIENSDYANYIMAQSMFECRQYNQALIYIDKAIEKNELNSNYKCFRAKTLIALKKYKEALKYIQSNKVSVFLKNDFLMLEIEAKMNLAQNDFDKKFYQIYSYYLSGNYYKTLKETRNVLNFNKNNPKILSLQAMAHLALDEFELAYNDFQLSYKTDKNFNLTIMGLGDCYFIKKDYKSAYNMYKKLFKTELNDEAVLKAELALELSGLDNNKLAKIQKLKETIENGAFIEYYIIANNILDDFDLKKKYTLKSLAINFLYQNSWDLIFKFDYNNKDFEGIDRLVFTLLFSDKLNAEYYYYSALSLDYKNNKREAFYELKKAVNLDPEYKPAVEFMNKLQNELI